MTQMRLNKEDIKMLGIRDSSFYIKKDVTPGGKYA